MKIVYVIFYIHFDLFCYILGLILARKYINRKEDRIIPKDESSYIAEIGKQIEIKDIMEVDDRSVTFGNRLEGKYTPYEHHIPTRLNGKKSSYLATKEGLRWALDAAGNTGQYIKYVNMKIDKHQSQINHIKKLQERFDHEISTLQSQKLEKIKLDKDSLEKLDIKQVTSILDQLSLGKRNTKLKLKKLENELGMAEKELEQQEIQIEEVREHLKETQSDGKNTFNIVTEMTALKIIKEELSILGKEKDVSKLSGAIDTIISSLGSQY